jgi:hypothetical protein
MTGGAGMVLSAELSEFLIEFAIGLQKSAIYPKGHPMLEEVSASLLRCSTTGPPSPSGWPANS